MESRMNSEETRDLLRMSNGSRVNSNTKRVEKSHHINKAESG